MIFMLSLILIIINNKVEWLNNSLVLINFSSHLLTLIDYYIGADAHLATLMVRRYS